MSGASNTPPENGRTSSSPEADASADLGRDFVCRDPDDRDLPCPICDGKGVYALDVPLDDPRFGKFQRCPNHPAHEDQDMLARLRRYGNLDAYRDKTFECFETTPIGGSYTQNVLSSLGAAKDAAQGFADNPQGWIVFQGVVGCGKTHLAVAIGNERLEQSGQQVIFVTAPDLLDLLRMTFDPRGEASYDDYFERIRNVSLLVLDDLGVENPSPWAKEKLFQLLNYRHVNELATVITTSQSVDDFDPWLSSRLLDPLVNVVAIVAPDYRRTLRAQTPGSPSVNLQLYSDMRFDSFETAGASADETENLRRGAQLARSWVGNPEGWLCLIGEYGTGKTHLAAAIAGQLYENGSSVVFHAAPDLLDFLRRASDPKSSALIDKHAHDLMNTPILILDDLRLGSGAPWAKEKLFQIIDYRYRAKMPTVITTSETLEEMDSRIATRLLDQRVCQIFAIRARSYVMRAPKRN